MNNNTNPTPALDIEAIRALDARDAMQRFDIALTDALQVVAPHGYGSVIDNLSRQWSDAVDSLTAITKHIPLLCDAVAERDKEIERLKAVARMYQRALNDIYEQSRGDYGQACKAIRELYLDLFSPTTPETT